MQTNGVTFYSVSELCPQTRWCYNLKISINSKLNLDQADFELSTIVVKRRAIPLGVDQKLHKLDFITNGYKEQNDSA